MVAERKKKKAPKTESLTIRLDPKMRFALDFVARMKGQTITKVIEMAVIEAANNEKFKEWGTDEWDNPKKFEKTWIDYWDLNEGIRLFNMSKEKKINLSFDEEFCIQFMKVHWKYFFNQHGNPIRPYFDVLWPIMPELLSIWEEKRAVDRQAVINIMESAFNKAGIPIPEQSDTIPPFLDV